MVTRVRGIRMKTLAAAVAVMASLAGTASAQVQRTEAEQLRAARIWTMEGILERAVSFGAESVLREVADVIADRPSLSSFPEVRGFPLVGHGLFFKARVARLQLPSMCSRRYLLQAAHDSRTLGTIQQLSERIASLSRTASENLRELMRQLERQLVSTQPRPAVDRSVSAPSLVAGPG